MDAHPSYGYWMPVLCASVVSIPDGPCQNGMVTPAPIGPLDSDVTDGGGMHEDRGQRWTDPITRPSEWLYSAHTACKCLLFMCSMSLSSTEIFQGRQRQLSHSVSDTGITRHDVTPVTRKAITSSMARSISDNTHTSKTTTSSECTCWSTLGVAVFHKTFWVDHVQACGIVSLAVRPLSSHTG